ncbi:hypothetical protein [Actinacidiphila glaucinigra]|uniref:hypothetical protein n=1 Tax=Actinacidiphila glaucinigra TaxID=235986 RepID=UPI0036718FFA
MKSTSPLHAVLLGVFTACALGLAGCGGPGAPTAESGASPAAGSATSSSASTAPNGELEIPEGADEELKRSYLRENLIAACMRKQGFTCTPHVTEWDTSGAALDGQDYDLAKKHRDKYGFGLYAPAVYPDDASLQGTEAYEKRMWTSPDTAYLKALSPVQRKAYDKAMGGALMNKGGRTAQVPGCMKDADDEVLGPRKSQAELDRERAAAEEQDRAAELALNGDPQLVDLAQKFANCLRGEGIAVTTTQPTAIGDMVKFQVSAAVPAQGVKGLDSDTARSKLAWEIGLATKDLTCGKEFRAAYYPKLDKHPFSGIGG